MTVFEFLLIAVSIIVGIGIAELLSGVVRIFRQQLAARPLHSLWVAIVFLQQVQFLWSRWDLRVRAEWAFPEFALVLLPSILLLLVAALLFPAVGEVEDLSEYLLRRRKAIFGLLTLLMMVFSVENWFLYDQAFGETGDYARFVQIFNLGVLWYTDRRWVHWTLGPLVLAIMVGFIFVITPYVS